jgi:hypothetical protein
MTVNFTNILRAATSYQSCLCTFNVLTIWVCNFLAKGFWRKAAHKMLVKLTPGFKPSISKSVVCGLPLCYLRWQTQQQYLPWLLGVPDYNIQKKSYILSCWPRNQGNYTAFFPQHRQCERTFSSRVLN